MEVQMSTSSRESPVRILSPTNLDLQQHQSETVHLRQGSLAVTEMSSPDGKYFSNSNSQVTEIEMFHSASRMHLQPPGQPELDHSEELKFDANLARNSRSNSYTKPPLPKKKMSHALVDNYLSMRADEEPGCQLRTSFTPRDEC